MEKELKIGVIGYSAQKFDENKATKHLKEVFNKISEIYTKKGYSKFVIVSGLTNLGIPKLAYEEARRRNWKTVGIACSKARDYPCFSVDEEIIVGKNWGDESETFINYIDILVKIGGGKQSEKEKNMFFEKLKREYFFDYKL